MSDESDANIVVSNQMAGLKLIIVGLHVTIAGQLLFDNYFIALGGLVISIIGLYM